jgi:phosphatidylserine decarboxylase
MRIPVAREGWIFFTPPVALSAAAFALGFPTAGAALAVVAVFLISFFRDPERRSDAPADRLLSPADGTVLSISPCSEEERSNGMTTQISIFMSVFNCHVNRAPAGGVVLSARHTPGRKMAAFADAASTENERNRVEIEASGRRIVFTQVAGALARRIVFRKKPGESVARGERVGMIRFGSRVDLLLPAEIEPLVGRGDAVRAGHTPVARPRGSS